MCYNIIIILIYRVVLVYPEIVLTNDEFIIILYMYMYIHCMFIHFGGS